MTQARIDRINSLLRRYPQLDESSREGLLRERRTLLRIVHDIPLLIQLPLDWEGLSRPFPVKSTAG
jgi:hypothetical protein